jgi:hypothetical protein
MGRSDFLFMPRFCLRISTRLEWAPVAHRSEVWTSMHGNLFGVCRTRAAHEIPSAGVLRKIERWAIHNAIGEYGGKHRKSWCSVQPETAQNGMRHVLQKCGLGFTVGPRNRLRYGDLFFFPHPTTIPPSRPCHPNPTTPTHSGRCGVVRCTTRHGTARHAAPQRDTFA